jgi:hypothetical protein
MFFDSHRLNLEDKFVFSLEESYQEWESTYGCDVESGGDDYLELAGDQAGEQVRHPAGGGGSKQPAAELAPASRSEPDASGEAAEMLVEDESVWKSSYVNWNQVAQADTSAFESLLAISFPLAEIITDLKNLSGSRAYVTELNEAYDALRRSTDKIVAESAARHFCELLEQACASFPALTAKCADLQSHVDEVLRKLA